MRLAHRTGVSRERLLNYLRSELIPDITSFVARRTAESEDGAAFAHAQLSRELAYDGILPLFGFPTRVRTLYVEPPGQSDRNVWPPNESAISRQLKIAVGEFAPGGEIVRDKTIYRSVGLVAYDAALQPVLRPYRNLETTEICTACGKIAEKDDATFRPCRFCNQGTFETRLLIEPLGFRTDYAADPRTYDWGTEFTPRGGSARLTGAPVPEDGYPVRSAELRYGRGMVYVVNDNNGDGYTLQSILEQPGIIDAREARRLDWRPADYVRPLADVGLKCKTTTDVLVVGANESLRRRFDVSPTSPARRAAWTSLGALLATVAAAKLDIDPHELEQGTWQEVDNDGQPRAFVFIADELENGAGFSEQIGDGPFFTEVLLDSLGPMFGERFEDRGTHTCDASCYRCLRSYANRQKHPLLDWRLGLDFVHLLLGHDLPNREHDYVAAVASLRAIDAEYSPVDVGPNHARLVRGDISLIVAHPFLRTDNAWIDGRPTLRTSIFDIVRLKHVIVNGIPDRLGSLQRIV